MRGSNDNVTDLTNDLVTEFFQMSEEITTINGGDLDRMPRKYVPKILYEYRLKDITREGRPTQMRKEYF
jgi:hypothetical protein